jgi:hypothetical protein
VITADQLFLHALGDYVIQSHWMATEKTRRWWPALVHAVTYALPFLVLGASAAALLVIGGTHAVIDHYRLARHIVWWRNVLFKPAPLDVRGHLATHRNEPFPADCPPYLGVWLVIIADNVLHVAINAAALRWL